MADTAQAVAAAANQSGAPSGHRIALKILSPGHGVPESIEINEVPTDITINTLKQRITLLSPSRPPADHQRLIYQGHVLANPSARLADVFGAEALRQHQSFTIHLVVRPNSSNSPNPPPASGRTSTPLSGPSGQSAAPLSAPLPHASQFPRPPIPPPGFPMPQMAGLPPAPGFPRFPVPGMPQGAFPHMPAMPMPGMPQGHFAPALGMPPGQYQWRAPTGPFPQAPGQHTPNAQGQTHAAGSRPSSAEAGGLAETNTPGLGTFQQIVGRQQAMRAAAGQQGAGTGPQGTRTPVEGQGHATQGNGTNTEAQTSNNTEDLPSASAPSAAPAPQAQAQAAQPQGPNGVRYQMTINQATFAIPAAQAMHMAGLQQQIGQPFPFPHNPAQQFQTPFMPQQFAGAHNPVAPPNFNAFAPSLQGEQPRGVPAMLNGAAFAQGLPAMTVPPTQLDQAFSSSATTVYLLSSPSGPHAILFSPQGVFSTTPHPAGPSNPLSHITPTTTTTSAVTQQAPSRPANQGGQEQVPGNAQPAGQVVQQGQHQPAGEAQQADAVEGDILAPIQPLLAHMWLLLRILAFAYFFLGGGQGWRRPLVLVTIAFVFFVLRGADAGAGVREAVRGWWEGVIGLPPRQAQPQNGQQVVPTQGNAQGAGQAGQAQPAPAAADPQEPQALSPLRARLRPLERALALFLASLWPGVGERTVRARREEDERQQRERQEADVQARQQALQGSETATDRNDESGESAETQPVGQPDTSADTTTSGADVGPEHSGQVRERSHAAQTSSAEGTTTGQTGSAGGQG